MKCLFPILLVLPFLAVGQWGELDSQILQQISGRLNYIHQDTTSIKQYVDSIDDRLYKIFQESQNISDNTDDLLLRIIEIAEDASYINNNLTDIYNSLQYLASEETLQNVDASINNLNETAISINNYLEAIKGDVTKTEIHTGTLLQDYNNEADKWQQFRDAVLPALSSLTNGIVGPTNFVVSVTNNYQFDTSLITNLLYAFAGVDSSDGTMIGDYFEDNATIAQFFNLLPKMYFSGLVNVPWYYNSTLANVYEQIWGIPYNREWRSQTENYISSNYPAEGTTETAFDYSSIHYAAYNTVNSYLVLSNLYKVVNTDLKDTIDEMSDSVDEMRNEVKNMQTGRGDKTASEYAQEVSENPSGFEGQGEIQEVPNEKVATGSANIDDIKAAVSTAGDKFDMFVSRARTGSDEINSFVFDSPQLGGLIVPLSHLNFGEGSHVSPLSDYVIGTDFVEQTYRKDFQNKILKYVNLVIALLTCFFWVEYADALFRAFVGGG